MMDTTEGDATHPLLSTARLLVSRLERLSADSIWAHRASGLRGSLLRAIEQMQNPTLSADQSVDQMETLLDQGFTILEHAAREIRPPNDF